MNNSNIFKEIKQYLSPQQVAEYYLQDKGKMSGNNVFYKSPFRNEKTASFCVNNEKGFHDYGDGWHGDIISFVQELYHISPIDAAKTIIQDFALPIEIYPPKSNHKEYVYVAIQNLSKDIDKETIYEHTGFRKVNGQLVYLHQGGAIGTNKDVKVDLSVISLERYKFTDKKYDLNKSIKTSLSILDLAKKEITIPLLALTYLSPLRSLFLEENIPLGFVTWLVGESGSKKSSLSSIIVSHFGDFERDTLPGGFKDTVNSIEKKAFTLKDTLFAIDDYYPSQTVQEGKKMDAVAESLFGLYGDRQARSRMKQDGQTVKMGFSARGMCIVTGESFPNMAEYQKLLHQNIWEYNCS